MRTKRIERILKLINTLQSGRSYTVEQLAELTGVNRRTVFRDLNLLHEAGIGYTFDRDSGRYRAEHAGTLPPVSFSTEEALALLLATRRFVGTHISPDHEAASEAALKLESLLPRQVLEYVGDLLRYVEIKAPQKSDGSSIRDPLFMLKQIIAGRRQIRVRYDSYADGEVIEDDLHPYRLLHIHRGWYMLAFSTANQAVRTYKIERFVEITPLEATYSMQNHFSVDGYFGNAWLMIRGDQQYHVRIRFTPRMAGNVEEVLWHKTQRIAHEADGSIIFEVDVDGLDEIAWWVLGYGDQARVLQPQALADMIRDHAKNLVAIYKMPLETCA